MSDDWTNEPRLERGVTRRPWQTAMAASLLLLLLWSGRDRLPHLAAASAPVGCATQATDNQAIPMACQREIARRNS